MCITLVSFNEHPTYPLILIFNRDEDFERPTEPLHVWTDHNGIIAGRDSLSGGTWLGINANGRFCALTNYSESDPKIREEFFQAPSANMTEIGTDYYLTRGKAPVDILTSEETIQHNLDLIWQDRQRYKSFNLLTGELKTQELFSFSINREDNMQGVHRLEPKTYCLSNCEIDGDWHKISYLKSIFKEYIQNTPEVKSEDLLDLMKNTDIRCKDYNDREAAVFVNFFDVEIYGRTVKYGTISTTCIMVDSLGNAKVVERTYHIDQEGYQDSTVEFRIH
jgi:uncharacterized protein with NRDE domain